MWNPSIILPSQDGEYVCYTNYNDIFILAFHDGKWEKAPRFNKGEKIAFWINLPNSKNPYER